MLQRGYGGVVVGHVAVGNGVAGLVQRRFEDASRSYTAAVVGGGAPVHGGNAAGLVCIAIDGGGQGLVPVALGGAACAREVAAALDRYRMAGPDVRVHPGILLAVDGGEAVVVEMRDDGTVGARSAEVGEAEDGGDDMDPTARLRSLITRLRQVEPKPHEGAAPVAGLAALLSTGEPPRLCFALGPPSCAVFVRHWPGLEVGPDEAATPEGAPLARLAAAVAQLTGTDPDLRRGARERLDGAEAEALREGEAAERMAARMDADTDDRGAAVRRLVAQTYSAGLAMQALEELAVPAPPGSKPGPRL